jgi:homoserine kinase
VANVAVGFDVLGFAVDAVGDRVRVSHEAASERRVVIDAVEGVVTDLPLDPRSNTAGVALATMLEALGVEGCFRVRLHKGIPLGSGMGGSAASAVGAVVAANALLDRPFTPSELLPFALAGEAAASGSPHADNAAPCLFGGLTAVVEHDPATVIDLPTPPGLHCVLVRPELRVDTREARASLKPGVEMERFVAQTMCLTGFLVACFRQDIDLLQRSMRDLVAGPQRAERITGFDDARSAALRAGALCFAVAGSGPSVFSWARSADDATEVEEAIVGAFSRLGVACQGWSVPLGCGGARIVESSERGQG